jgi:THO complex subunit 1
LSDLAFQRHILVQALILIDFLLSLTERSKKKLYKPNTQKALQYGYTLSETDVSGNAAPPESSNFVGEVTIVS